MKKILFIGMSSIPGGIETFVINVFLGLMNKNYKFEFINTSNKPIAYSSLIRRNGGIIRDIPVTKGITKYLTRYNLAKNFFKKHHDYDIVDLNTPSINRIYWIKAARKYGIRHCIIHSHNCSSRESFIHNIFAKPLASYNRWYLNNHKQILKLAASYNCGRWMFKTNSDFKIINNGIDPLPFIHNQRIRHLLRKKLNINNRDKVIITTARLEHQKNYTKIINVFKNIHKYCKATKLVIIGSGSEFSKIYDMVKFYGLNHYVYFLGKQNRNKIPKWLNIADMMLMPSLYEAVPFSLTEAQAAGLPALVSLKSIPKEANITGKVRYLSLNDSDLKWAKMALNILNHPCTIYDKIKMNQQLKHSKYNVNYSVKQMNKIFSKIVE